VLDRPRRAGDRRQAGEARGRRSRCPAVGRALSPGLHPLGQQPDEPHQLRGVQRGHDLPVLPPAHQRRSAPPPGARDEPAVLTSLAAGTPKKNRRRGGKGGNRFRKPKTKERREILSFGSLKKISSPSSLSPVSSYQAATGRYAAISWGVP